MIKRLKRKFIALSMVSLFVLLALVVFGMNLANYASLLHDADDLLSVLSQHKGHFPPDGVTDREPGRLPPQFSPETPHETRYFTVLVGTEGTFYVDTSKTVTVDEATARDYHTRAVKQGKVYGFVEQFRYSMTEDAEGIRYVFLDCGRRLEFFRTYAYFSTAFALLGYAVISVILVVVAGRIVRPVKESYEKQKRFITDAGHELKTPLSILRANADLFTMEEGPNEYIDEIRTQTDRLDELTGRLVYLAKLEEMSEGDRPIEFALSDVVMEEASAFAAPAQLGGRICHMEIEPMLSYVGNETHIRSLVSILMDNAVKYARENTAITCALKRHGRSFMLTVSNTPAVQISEEQLALLFDRFYRPDPARSSSVGGHGLGLSIARAIVLAHGGRIQARCKEELLQMIITLPMKGKGEGI